MAKPKDITGTVFGRLTAISRGDRKNDTYQWICECSCGKRVSVYLPSLTKGATRSCGCLQKEVASSYMSEHKTVHGNARRGRATKEYSVWANMLRRCNDESNKYYKSYGGRGIKVCSEWYAFTKFLTDVGECPEGLTLDRIDNAKGYYKENCRWTTKEEQARNTRTNRIISFNGYSKTLSEWAAQTGITRTAIALRIDRYGWTVEQALGFTSRKPVTT